MTRIKVKDLLQSWEGGIGLQFPLHPPTLGSPHPLPTIMARRDIPTCLWCCIVGLLYKERWRIMMMLKRRNKYFQKQLIDMVACKLCKKKIIAELTHKTNTRFRDTEPFLRVALAMSSCAFWNSITWRIGNVNRASLTGRLLRGSRVVMLGQAPCPVPIYSAIFAGYLKQKLESLTGWVKRWGRAQEQLVSPMLPSWSCFQLQ